MTMNKTVNHIVPNISEANSKATFILLAFMCLSSQAWGNELKNILNKSHDSNNKTPVQECPVKVEDNDSEKNSTGRNVDFNMSCFVELEKINIKDYQIVDVRRPPEYQLSHIPGSINIPTDQIAYKRRLKTKNLLLVNQGLPQFEMGQYCQILKDKGFKNVNILKGGIHNWLSHGLKLAGVNNNTKTYDLVDVRQFFMDYEHQLVQAINIGSRTNGINRAVPSIQNLSLSLDDDAFISRIQSILNGRKNPLKQLVLLGTEDEYQLAKIKLKSILHSDVYFLITDLNALIEYKKKRLAINQARINGPKKSQCGV